MNDDAEEADTEADDDVTSSIEDSATGVRIVSQSDELNGKSIVVTAMNPSGSINADHDLYDIHVLNADGTLYSLNNPVTVYLPANGFVSNVYYLGDIGETLEAVNFTTDGGYAVFQTDGFSQYAVVYGKSNEDNTSVAPVVSNDKDSDADDSASNHANNHSAVYTGQAEDSDDEGQAAAADSNGSDQGGSGGANETEMLPNTGVPEQSTTLFASILAALGLGFLVKRRKTTDK